ncbi:MAG: ABC transporter permease [Candidatus Fimivivens sp.]|nr:ABC transporter permease [Candidatus Fimivivens sp.]
MSKYIFKRILMLIPVIIGVTFLVFFILSLTPGDVASLITNGEGDAATLEAIREELGLNDPLLVQYGRYMIKLVQGNMGESYQTGRDVFKTVMGTFPATIKLTFWSMVVAIGIAIPVGILSATKQYTPTDYISMTLAMLGVATPNFWLGLMLILAFSLHLGWFPSGGMSGLESFVLPAVTLGTGAAALITRMTRSSMLEVIRQDYIRTAKAKGVNNSVVIRKHALRNALIPVVTVVGLQFGHMLGGAVLTETVFSWPGVGRLMVDSIKSKDTPMVLGCIVLVTICFSLVNLVIDIAYAFIDPRIKAVYKK